MQVFRCAENDIVYARQAMQNVKASTDEIPIELVTENAVTKFLSDSNNCLIVAVIEDNVVGYIVAYELQRVDREQKMMFFYDTSVLYDYRRRGIGFALIECLKNICIEKNMMKMYVPTESSNYPACGLYVKAGGLKTDNMNEVSFTWYFN